MGPTRLDSDSDWWHWTGRPAAVELAAAELAWPGGCPALGPWPPGSPAPYSEGEAMGRLLLLLLLLHAIAPLCGLSA